MTVVGLVDQQLWKYFLTLAIESQLTLTIRPMYSNPAGQGTKIVGRILENDELFKQWIQELNECVERLRSIREDLKTRLDKLAPKHNWLAIALAIFSTFLLVIAPMFILPLEGKM